MSFPFKAFVLILAQKTSGSQLVEYPHFPKIFYSMQQNCAISPQTHHCSKLASPMYVIKKMFYKNDALLANQPFA